MGRAPCCDKANVKKGPWSPEEDAKLKAYIDKYGTGGNWIALPQKIGLKRCGKSCRLRWLNYLRPNIKHGGFTEEEDNTICSLYISIGSRWSIIAAQLPGRTDNDIKNYWNTRLKKKLLGRRKNSNMNRLSSINPSQDPIKEENNLSTSALERLQLHMQLQNPFSFYNNPMLWPKLNPLHHKTIHTLDSDHQNFNQMDQIQSTHHQQQDELLLQSNVVELSETVEGFGSQVDLDDLVNNNKSSTFVLNSPMTSDQIVDNHCSGEMDGSNKDNDLGWWSDEFDAGSSSWGSTTVFHDQHQEMYHDYVIGYSMQ